MLLWYLKCECVTASVKFTAPHAVPLGHDGHFTCQTMLSGSKPAWGLVLNGRTRISTFPFYHGCNLPCTLDSSRGITYTYSASTTSSTLIIAGNELNNGTIVLCVEYMQMGGIDRDQGKFLVYGKYSIS